MPYGSVYSGFYSDFKDMPQDQKNTVIAAREKKKKKGKNLHKVSEMKSLVSEVASLKRMITASTSTETLEEGVDEEATPNNAGPQFGGYSKKTKS